MGTADIPLILIVDDTETNVDILVDILGDTYEISVAMDGESVFEIVAIDPPDLILLDIMMPGIDGYEVCRRLKAQESTQNIPVIFITAKGEAEDETRGFELGAVDYVIKPFVPSVVLARVDTHVKLSLAREILQDHNRLLERLVQERTAELQHTRLEIIRKLGRASEFKDKATGSHIERMSHYCRVIGAACGLDAQTNNLLFLAAPMHDVGKIGVPDSVLLKPGKLTEDEFFTIKKHTLIGAEIIGEHPSGLLHISHTIALTHHERWDGMGYPHGLRGIEIPLVGRIAAIADVFDALTSRRPYKEPWPHAQALAYILENSGTQFDPVVVVAFYDHFAELVKISEEFNG